MIPPQLLIALGLTVAGAAGVWFGLAAPRIDLAELQASQLEQQLTDTRATLDARTGQLQQMQHQADQLLLISQQMTDLQHTVRRNDAAQQQALQELRRNDQETRDYLVRAVPAGLGRLYARPETTDPGAYRAAPSVPADAVPAARAGTAAEQ